MPYTMTPQYLGPLTSVPVNPFRLRARIKPEDTALAECKFYDDSFRPDYSIAARFSTIKLLKGTAVQISRPSAASHLIDIGNGIFLSKQDYNVFNLMYHTNLIGEPEPYPTEFLVTREEDLTLILPSGYEYQVTFAETPTVEPVRLIKGEWVYTLRCRFRVIPDEDEQEEI